MEQLTVKELIRHNQVDLYQFRSRCENGTVIQLKFEKPHVLYTRYRCFVLFCFFFDESLTICRVVF